MKALKYAGIVLVAISILILLIAAFVSKEVAFEKSISISAPVDSVWTNVKSLAALDKWSPWNDYDPGMKKSMTGKDGTVGASASWESEVVGNGSQTLSKIEPPALLETDLKFYGLWESEAKAFIRLSPEGEGTKVTWAFKSEMPYPFNIMKLFMNMEEMMDKDWKNGLDKLKTLSEK